MHISLDPTCVRSRVGGVWRKQVHKHLKPLSLGQGVHSLLQALRHRASQHWPFLRSLLRIQPLIKQLPGALPGGLIGAGIVLC